MKPQHISPRNFLHQTRGALGATSLTPRHRGITAGMSESRRATTLEEACKVLGFDPHAADGFTVL